MKSTFVLVFSLFILISFGQTLKNSSALNLEWKNKGPSNVSGKINAILWDKDDENILYTGGLASGLYKSEDKGNHWESVASYYGKNPNISSIVQSISGSIFIGTGSLDGSLGNGKLFNHVQHGNGVYRSQDGGNTWNHLSNTEYIINGNPWGNVICLATHPTNNNVLLAGTTQGLYISTNADYNQPTFSPIAGFNGIVTDIKITTDGKTAWLSSSGSLYKSESHQTDFANGWTLSSPINSYRAQIGVSSINNNGDYTIYSSFTKATGCLQGIYKSIDKGVNWLQIDSSSSLDPFLINNTTYCQGWYNHALTVNPQNSNIIYLGGESLFTLSAQETLVQIDDLNNINASDYLPPRKHTIVINPNNNDELMIGTSNGIYFSDNANSGHPYNLSFSRKSKGLNTGLALKTDIGKNGEILSKIYDKIYFNGYNNSSPFNYTEIVNYSNLTTEISNYNLNTILFSGSFSRLKKSIDNGVTYFPAVDNITDPDNCGYVFCDDFLPCGFNEAMNYFHETYIYESATKVKYFVPTICGSSLFMSENILGSNNIEYYAFSFPLVSGITDMSFSKNGDRMVYVSGNFLGITDHWDSFSSSTPSNDSINNSQINFDTINLNSIGISMTSGVSIDPNDKDHIIVTEDGFGSNSKVAKTTDGGISWTIIHNNLPEIPIYDCVIDANNSNNYILATHHGIWASNDSGDSWKEENNGLNKSIPIFRIRQEWVLEEDCHILLASGFGSGVYTSTSLTNCNKNVEEEIWGVYNSIENINSNLALITVFPNPTNGIITIELNTESKRVQTFSVIDILGHEVFNGTITKSIQLNTKDWKAGTYFIKTKSSYAKLLIK